MGMKDTAFVDEYLAFARMLLARGRHEGKALLMPASVSAMTTNHLTASQRAGGEMILGPARGWGYGMSMVTDSMAGQPAAGSFGWIGGFGSSWFSDPSRDLTMILMTNHEFASFRGDPIRRDCLGDTYRALV
jgi:CubicO group peptidase (beta-lactamase class C family)